MSLLWHDPVAAEALGLPVVGPVPLDVVRVDAVAVAALQVPEARAARHAALGAPQPRQDHGPVAAVALALWGSIFITNTVQTVHKTNAVSKIAFLWDEYSPCISKINFDKTNLAKATIQGPAKSMLPRF